MGTEQQIYDLSLDRMSCPYCASIAKRIGSSRFSWRCEQSGHQFDFPGPFGYAVGIGGYAFVSGPGTVGDDRKG